MKELEKHDRDSQRTSIESIIKKQKQKEFKLIESIKPKPGHILFEINTNTGEITQAPTWNTKRITWHDALRLLRSLRKNKRVEVKKDCVYISALNAEMAMKRYLSEKGSAMIPKGYMKF